MTGKTIPYCLSSELWKRPSLPPEPTAPIGVGHEPVQNHCRQCPAPLTPAQHQRPRFNLPTPPLPQDPPPARSANNVTRWRLLTPPLPPVRVCRSVPSQRIRDPIRHFSPLKRGLTNHREIPHTRQTSYQLCTVACPDAHPTVGHHIAIMMSARLCTTDVSCTGYQDKCYCKLMERPHGPMIQHIQELIRKVSQSPGFKSRGPILVKSRPQRGGGGVAPQSIDPKMGVLNNGFCGCRRRR